MVEEPRRGGIKGIVVSNSRMKGEWRVHLIMDLLEFCDTTLLTERQNIRSVDIIFINIQKKQYS